MKKPNDKEIEDMLKKLPTVRDRQSKEDLYRSITPKINQQKRKIAPWFFPSMATVAVVLLLAVFIPVYLSNMDPSTMQDKTGEESSTSESSSQPAKDDRADESRLSEEDDHLLDEGANPKEESPTTQEAKVAEEETAEEQNGLEILLLESPHKQRTTFAYPGRNGEVIIPVTPLAVGENRQATIEREGLSERAIEEVTYEVEEADRTAIVTFPEGFTVSGSAWTQAIVESIRWELEAYEVNEIKLQTEAGEPVSLGNYGEIEELPVIQNGEYFYQVYQFEGAADRFLVPLPASGTPPFKELLVEMQEPKNAEFVTPAVPDHVRFVSVSEGNEQVTIDIEHDAWASEQQLLTMIEAILATAGQSGFEKVQFEGINVREFSTYDLNDPITVPAYINPVQTQG